MSVPGAPSIGMFAGMQVPQLSANANCPQGTSWNDGCLSAPSNPLMPAFGRTLFFNTTSTGYTQDGIARQSGQAPGGYPQIPQYNITGVDFATGPSIPVGGWKDPKDLPSIYPGCSWSTVTIGTGSYQQMGCNHVNNLDIENYDFTTTQYPAAAGQSCITLYIRNGNTGTITIKNNKDKLGIGCTDGTTTLNYLFYIANGNNAPIDFENNYLSGSARQFPGVELDSLATLSFNVDAVSNPGVTTVPGTNYGLIIKRNYVVDVAGRPFGSNTYSSVDIENNFAEGWSMPGASSQIHGELIANGRIGSGLPQETVPNWTYLNNTILMDSDALSQGATMLWVTTGVGGSSSIGDYVTNLYYQYNTTVNNLVGGPGGPGISGTAGLWVANVSVANAYIDNNFMDPGGPSGTGASFCFRDSVPMNGTLIPDSSLTPGGAATNYNMTTGVAQKHWVVDGWSGVPLSPPGYKCDEP